MPSSLVSVISPTKSMEFFLNVFTEFAGFNDKIFVITVKGFEPLPTLGNISLSALKIEMPMLASPLTCSLLSVHCKSWCMYGVWHSD